MTRFIGRRQLLIFAASLLIAVGVPRQANCDFFGGDLPLLAEIVANTAQQLARLGQIIQTGDDSLSLIRDINRGINDSLNLIRTVYPNADPGIFREWSKVDQAIRDIEGLYGAVSPSRDAPIQRKTDESVAEAIALNNSMYQYAGQMDEIGESIKAYSHATSPGGAQKLTAQSLGVLINLTSQSLRAQATSLKLQAESLAIVNHREKDGSRYLQESSDALKAQLSNQPVNFALPRF